MRKVEKKIAMNMIKNKKGFTLIELLVVISIIGIIASMVLIGLNSTRRLGRDARRISDVGQLRTAAELFFNGCGVYPEGNYVGGNPNCTAVTTLYDMEGAAWGISQFPRDPSTGLPYDYCGGDTVYTVQALLEDPNNSVFNQAQPVSQCATPLPCTGQNYCIAS